MEKEIVNLTPHELTVFDERNAAFRVPPSGQQARVSAKSVVVGSVNGIPVRKTEYGDVVGLPDPRPNTVYVVSTIVQLALRAKGINRPDVVSPDTSPDSAVRNESGQVIGVRYFQQL